MEWELIQRKHLYRSQFYPLPPSYLSHVTRLPTIHRNINETIFWLDAIISVLTLWRTNCVTRRYNQLWPVRPRLDCVNIEKTQKVLRRRSKWSKSHLGLGQTCGVQDKRQAVILILGRSTRHGMQRWPKSLYWSPSTDRGGKREGIIGKKPCY